MAIPTGLHMFYNDMMGKGCAAAGTEGVRTCQGWGGAPMGAIATMLVAKIVICFLFVWLVVYLLNRWHLAPFGKKKGK